MNRRRFLGTTGAILVAGSAGVANKVLAAEKPHPTPARLPKWRGFNLLEKFVRQDGTNAPFQESDFALTQEWGFDFARLPLSYRCWADPENWKVIKEPQLKDVDEAVEFGRKHAVHVNINLHRAPGYCVNPPKEPLDLWKDEAALEACAFHWAYLAKRYKGISNDRVSFDLLNEPPDIPEETYVRVVKALVAAIREADPERLIIADGLKWGGTPVHGLASLKIAQSTRGYEPIQISHYRANWMKGSDTWPEPQWPLKVSAQRTISKDTIRRERIEPWKKLEQSGVGVHVGEWGAFNRTPHGVTLAWMRDCLDLWREAGWGWSLWNLRGAFGVLNSERADVQYESFRGHKLDRAMLEVLQAG